MLICLMVISSRRRSLDIIIFSFRYGFMMPERYIRQIGEEMWEGMKVCAGFARNSELGPSKTSEKEAIYERQWLARQVGA